MGEGGIRFDWDDSNRKHLARHRVASYEAEAAILDPKAIFLEIQFHGGEERTKAVGITASGRVLAVIFTVRDDAIRPITAYTAPPVLQKAYLEARKG